jgi:hypothetical protein
MQETVQETVGRLAPGTPLSHWRAADTGDGCMTLTRLVKGKTPRARPVSESHGEGRHYTPEQALQLLALLNP